MKGVGGINVQGGSYPATIWGAYMREALADQPALPFPEPDYSLIPGATQIGSPPTSTSLPTSSTSSTSTPTSTPGPTVTRPDVTRPTRPDISTQPRPTVTRYQRPTTTRYTRPTA
jgi:membrane peptidoglycan carboxypeptidase